MGRCLLITVLAKFQSRPKVPEYAVTCRYTPDGYTSDRAKTALYSCEAYSDSSRVEITQSVQFTVFRLGRRLSGSDQIRLGCIHEGLVSVAH